ncbi:MAG: transposase, partial [Candidatus Sericytochromatia bacterium]|nr:transposase [Candidatus Sericytochromatia bacterium]
MKSSRFSEEQIIRAIKKFDAGRKVGDVCRELGVTDQTTYNWRRKCGMPGHSPLRAPPVAEAWPSHPGRAPNRPRPHPTPRSQRHFGGPRNT